MRPTARPHRESGVSTVVFLLLFGVLFAGVGMSADVGSSVYQKKRLQNAADAAVLAIGRDCVLNNPCDTGSAGSTAAYFITENATSGTASVPSGPSGGSVTVDMVKNVPFNFTKLIGLASKDVHASATAEWGLHPTEGTPTIPYVVSLCEYAQHDLSSTTPYLLRTAVSDPIKTGLANGNEAQRDVIKVYPEMAKYESTCSVPSDVSVPDDDGTIRMLNSGLWLSGFEKSSGDYIANSNGCNGHIRDLGAVLHTSAMNTGCTQKYADSLGVGEIAMLAIYAPNANTDHSGIQVETCVPGECVKNGGIFDIKIVGYAPFKVTAWRLNNQSSTAPMTAGCSTVKLGNKAISCDGIEGYFLRAVSSNPDFEYGPGGVDFGATQVRLSE